MSCDILKTKKTSLLETRALVVLVHGLVAMEVVHLPRSSTGSGEPGDEPQARPAAALGVVDPGGGSCMDVDLDPKRIKLEALKTAGARNQNDGQSSGLGARAPSRQCWAKILSTTHRHHCTGVAKPHYLQSCSGG